MPIKPYKQATTGRVTNPRGTFLSNPSTSASGFLGGPLGKNPASVPSYVGIAPVSQISPVTPGFAKLPSYARNSMLNSGNIAPVSTNTGKEVLFNNAGTPLSGTGYQSTRPDVAWDVAGNKYTLDTSTGQYQRDQTSAFTPKTNGLDSSVLGKAPQAFSNNLVGLTLGADTKQLEMKTAMQIFPGLTGNNLNESMQKIGYSFVQGPRGGSYVYTGQGADPNFKPVNASAPSSSPSSGLAPGERVKLDNGATIIGGQALANGKEQYTYISKLRKGQNFNSKIQQDANGNWVRYVYAAYDKRKYKGQRQQAQSSAQTTATPAQDTQGGTINQLVNLRVNYG